MVLYTPYWSSQDRLFISGRGRLRCSRDFQRQYTSFRDADTVAKGHGLAPDRDFGAESIR